MLRRIWAEERQIVIRNLKKMKKAWLHKDKVDEIIYPVRLFQKKLEDGTVMIFLEVIDVISGKVIAIYDFDMIFEIDNPEVKKWLKSYVPRFSKKLEEVSVEKLRAQLIAGMEAGEGIPELLRRVYETYDDWGFRRAEKIARTECLRASNKAALETYRQSGVVTEKIWITYFDKRTCPHCERLDGDIISIDKDFVEYGTTMITQVEEDGKLTTHKLDINYEHIESPPLHAQCRCAVGAYIED